MLTRLSIENYAIIEQLDVEFDSRLNIITGETGAGKSIMLGALALLLGNRSDSSLFKDATHNCVVEGEWQINASLQPLFDELDIPFEEQTIIRRIITPAGKSRVFVNDMPTTVGDLRLLSERLIDVHSQHQNLILSSEDFRQEALDAMAESVQLATEYRTAYQSYRATEQALTELNASIEQIRSEEEWLRHQCDELSAANLRDGEIEELEAEQQQLANADSINEALGVLHEALDNDLNGTLLMLKERRSALSRIESFFPAATELRERLDSIAIELKDIDATAASYLQRIYDNPQRLEEIDNRLDMLYSLCRKHRCEDIAALRQLHAKYEQQLSTIEHSNERQQQLEEELRVARQQAMQLASALHAQRAKIAPQLESEVVAILRSVGIVDAQFCVDIEEVPLRETGADRISFLFSANKGAAVRPIERIASGGELSRVMLALKATLAKRMELPTIIFDEIDTGISGRTASAVGDIIAELAQSMQVIDITHLPQVASKGNRHLLVYKSEGTVQIKALDDKERITEIAAMLSGDNITDAAIDQARNLLNIH